MKQRILSILLCLAMLLSILPLAANAAEAGTYGDFTYEVLSDGTVSITRCNTGCTTAVIPASIDGKAVTTIGSYAFNNCASMTSVTIPDSITSIEEYAFRNCSSLTSVTLPSSLFKTGTAAFTSCTALRTVHLPDTFRQIARSMFSNCTNLTDINLPSTVDYIADFAFSERSAVQRA